MTKQKPRQSLAGFSLYRGLGTSIYVLFVIRIINRFGDFVQLLLVLILTGKLNLTPAQAGFFVSLSVAATMLGQLLSAPVAERWGQKRPLVLFQSMVILSYAGCALSYASHPQLIPYLILLGSPFRGGTAPLTNTMVAEFSNKEQLSQSFSLLYLGTNVGVALGPMAASFLYARSLFLLFSFSTLLLSLSTVLLMIAIPNVMRTRRAKDEATVEKGDALHLSPILVLFFLGFALYSLTYGQNSFTLPLQFASLFGETAGSQSYAFLMSVNAVTVLVATAFLTIWTHKIGQLKSMALAMLFYVFGYTVYAGCTSFVPFLVATCIWTLGEILMATNANVFVNAYTPPSLRSRANAYLMTTSSLGHALSPSYGGLLLLVLDYRQLWLINAGLCFLLGCGYIALNKHLKK